MQGMEEKEKPLGKGAVELRSTGTAFDPPRVKAEVVLATPFDVAPEKQFISDHLPQIKRKLAIAILAFGDSPKVWQFVGIPKTEFEKLRNDPEVKNAIAKGCCWTREEIVARLCVEAENAPKSQERLAALRMLMEYRGIAAPEGSARSFSRILGQFKVTGNGS